MYVGEVQAPARTEEAVCSALAHASARSEFVAIDALLHVCVGMRANSERCYAVGHECDNWFSEASVWTIWGCTLGGTIQIITRLLDLARRARSHSVQYQSALA